MARNNTVTTLLDAVDATGAGDGMEADGSLQSFVLTSLTTAGAGSCVANVEASNDNTNWLILATITLTTGTTVGTDASHGIGGSTCLLPYKFYRGNVTTLTGTNATATLKMNS